VPSEVIFPATTFHKADGPGWRLQPLSYRCNEDSKVNPRSRDAAEAGQSASRDEHGWTLSGLEPWILERRGVKHDFGSMKGLECQDVGRGVRVSEMP
jgi:hypothetical protein